jgi:EAL domain-containing protein (putative c-di-GMP-specific phosphodiesterase class I)/DNA-binding NarL/FixJ family response regulator
MRAVIFDDDTSIGLMIAKVAIMAGIEAVAVTTPDAFMRCMQINQPDLVMLDLQLGGTDGVQQLRALATQRYAGMLVLMSGFDTRVLATARVVAENLHLKVAGVLEKPLHLGDIQQMFERVRSLTDLTSVERIRRAVTTDEMSLDFQPIVSRKPNTLRKLEALIRWDHPSAGRIAPDQFLPIAESDPTTIDLLTDWVVGAAVDAYQVLTELGIAVPLSVNVSPQNLNDLTLPDRIEERVHAGGMPPHHLCLEITESTAFADPACTMDILSRLRLKGMQLSIDDFGVGYSSLKLLRQMPFSEIKIDRSFVTDILTSRDTRAIVKSILDLSSNMEISCVVEGVESEETASLLEQMGATMLQGFLIGRPMPVEAVTSWQGTWLDKPSPSVRPSPRAAAVRTDRVLGEAPPGAAADAVRLSPRQIDVMRLLSDGLSVKEIARRLNIGIGTVKVHLALAYSALGSHNRIEAVKRASSILPGEPAS